MPRRPPTPASPRLPQGLQLKRHIDNTLGSGNITEAVKLPPGEDLNEWLAVNTVDFYNAVSVLYSTLEEYCTARTCEVMNAGSKVGGRRRGAGSPARGPPSAAPATSRWRLGQPGCLAPGPRRSGPCRLTPPSCRAQYEYLWVDGAKFKKPTRIPAPDYINNLFDWIEAQVGAGGAATWGAWSCALAGARLQPAGGPGS
jgi:MOB kinase activator 1